MKLNEQLPRLPPAAHGGAIAHLALVAEHGGQQPHVAGLARELALAGIRVDIFTRRDAPTQRRVVQLGERVRVIHVPAGPAQPLPKEQRLACMPPFARFVTRFARRLVAPYDIVHAHGFLSGLVAQQLKLALGIPYVITFHALGEARRLFHVPSDAFPAERIRIERALMREANRLIAESAQDRLDMEQLYGAAPQRITVAPRGFDPNELWPLPRAAARAQLGLAPEHFTVLQLGSLAPHKGVDTVIQGLAMLRERHGIDAHLVVAGAGGEAEAARLRALTGQLGVGEQVRFAGQLARSALRLWYGAADVFVTTPWYEPFGITPVEAMACARPVIGSEVGGIKSTVVDGVTGFLIPSRDPRALAERLALLRADRALARRMGDEGLLRAWRHYTWRAVAQQACAVYATVLDESRPGSASGFTPF